MLLKSLFSSFRLGQYPKVKNTTYLLFVRPLTGVNSTPAQPQTERNDYSALNIEPFPRSGTRSLEQERSRRCWTQEETDRLLDLYKKHGPKYTLISKYFPGRSVPTIFNRCRLLFSSQQHETFGPWEKNEIEALRQLTEKHFSEGRSIDWTIIQAKLPRRRPIHIIKQTWYFTVNPRLNHGRWSAEENAKLEELINIYGTKDWNKVSDMLGTRSPRQCLERYRYQIQPPIKGKFSAKEDRQIMKAIRKYGDSDFLRIKEAINSPRTARHISQHYRYALDPAFDRSPWTDEEAMQVYHLVNKWGHDMVKVKAHMKSSRHIKDMWNHYYVIHRSKSKKDGTQQK